MAGSPARLPILSTRQTTRQQQPQQPPSLAPTVRYHIDFQDFLDDLDAPFFNPYPADRPYST